ncbi:MAG: rhamnogalacturonan acetylesterase [Verrucomicrobia bacterium]|nr:rhamnogalacturonan acetylesterase [Verrucomicrobiota bacterium]
MISSETKATTTVVLVGDSTMADWANEKPARGWGQLLPEYLTDDVRVVNLAVCGMSTKTFPDTGNWQKALASGAKYLLIQFGHNDSHAPDKPESTKADGEFTTNLERFVAEARTAGITPILVTPVHRRMYGADGKPSTELAPYAAATKRVAEKLNVPLIDLYAVSGEYFEKIGEAGSVGITVSDVDRTHFTEQGARQIAGFVAAGFKVTSPDAAQLVKP